MKKITAFLSCALIAMSLAACDGVTTPDNAQARVDSARQLTADSNAELMMQNAVNYCSSCAAGGVTVKSGRYAGKLDTANGSLSFDGSSSDFDRAFDTYTNGMTSGYYAVMINNGAPTAAYWSESDLSSVDFTQIPEDMVVGVKTE
ncbi:MAG: hypothetical protein IJ080_05500 [Oscillospiraceae bacterium]|nr:hypothetical protein [Oscillospiraceae bacterium]MBQ8979200.1 hypothetical protein [Oscillospiraceae bacterium]